MTIVFINLSSMEIGVIFLTVFTKFITNYSYSVTLWFVAQKKTVSTHGFRVKSFLNPV